MLETYINSIRPKFIKLNNPDETGLFLSQHGKPMSLQTLNKRFHEHLDRVDLDDQHYVPYSLRHSSVTEKRGQMSLEAVQKIHGHIYGSTTENYTHLKDHEIYEEVADAVNSQLDFLDEDDA